MDRREILSKGSAIQKAIAAKEPSENILTILRDLKANVRPSEDLLRSTGIGKIVNKVKGIPGMDPQVAQLASEIISRWRHIVNEQKLASGTSTPVGARSNGTSSPAPKANTPTPKAASPAGVAPDKRNWKADKVPRDDLTNDTARNNCIGLMYDGLCLGSDLPMKQILDLAKEIESAALNLPEAKGSSSSPVYKDKIRSLYQNLKNKSNPGLRKRILSGEVTAVRFVSMTHEEMKSKQQREEEIKIAKENMNNAMVAQEEKSVSTSLECGKCHQKKVSYSQAQTRSADEPMTTFCECLNCGNRWKFS
ncbi:transcription elongation factor TFIIS [Exophiala dermatitidis]|uniref:Transcription elongation factor n=2 Tax=Exophiala dermatitidis TaxID=5970 RepID=H6C548_EXODN|nr:transcription elongation factor S-II [Exophiala dermatitidis NIH/UT8656]KAJ4505487.1 transcription elongation factor TFIIS [Exophiala dermatitidis]EHY59760.1 transcription elongation factor S-II [Exophiala dermatitidis NIH/UT8656]KAJ4507091.1 transcription elongation factor TFIIS [Exophiala dermatitidis]KAJ4507686.1 transcription elongation factor TFIIS [Exophiala dermatitidis]KAJ4533011.1 transcription elongation factor TFIIS [Exophiala dermatitidis]